jgi:DNA-directed RNA polymerase subunit RPC12/RpoP
MGKLVMVHCPHCDKALKMEIFDFPRKLRCRDCGSRMIILPDGMFENGSRTVPMPSDGID